MVSWWGRDSQLNNKKNQARDFVLMNSAYGSSGSFGSRVMSTLIGKNTYTGRRTNLFPKPKPVNGHVHKYDLKFSYLISHFSWLPQAVSKVPIDHLQQKVGYAYMMIHPVINGFNPNEVKINLHICYPLIVTFGIR